ncbi:MAG: Bug family tripartite tricarboxylate transporter substrate binding protein [Burkholderiales bacterium]
MNRLSVLAIGLAMLATVVCPALQAQSPLASSGSFPTKPVRILSVTPAGGILDVAARQLAAKLTPALGQPVLVEPRPGAGGIIAMEAGARSVPDGHTLVICSFVQLTVNPSLYDRLPYDAVRDFAPVSLLFLGPTVLLAQPAFPANSVAELVQLAKAQPGKLMYGSSGSGFPPHIFTEELKYLAGIDLVHVPYKGPAASVAALLAGEVSVIMEASDTVIPYLRSGRLKALAVNGKKRVASLPNVPTFDEAGVTGIGVSWVGIVAPAGTPSEIVYRLNREFARALEAPDIKAYYDEAGRTVVASSPEIFAAVIRDEIPRWREVVKSVGIKPD